jgi:hypothetical protein
MSKHLGIKVKFVGYFTADIHGKLLPREKRILINARKPRFEHIFTLLHEIGHFLIHFKMTHRIPNARYLDIHWKSQRLAQFFSKVRRVLRRFRNSDSGKEWEADLWAMCAFVYLTKLLGCRKELNAFCNHHPEKRKLFLLAKLGTIFGNTKRRLQDIYNTLLLARFARRITAPSF